MQHYSSNLVSLLNQAISAHLVVRLIHESYEKGFSERVIEPMALFDKYNRKHVVAWCQLRNDYRTFRLDRVQTAVLGTINFDPREDFNLDDYKEEEEKDLYNLPDANTL